MPVPSQVLPQWPEQLLLQTSAHRKFPQTVPRTATRFPAVSRLPQSSPESLAHRFPRCRKSALGRITPEPVRTAVASIFLTRRFNLSRNVLLLNPPAVSASYLHLLPVSHPSQSQRLRQALPTGPQISLPQILQPLLRFLIPTKSPTSNRSAKSVRVSSSRSTAKVSGLWTNTSRTNACSSNNTSPRAGPEEWNRSVCSCRSFSNFRRAS